MSSTYDILLTLGEDERVRRRLKDRLQLCQALSGQPRISGNATHLQSQVEMASLLSDMATVPAPNTVIQKSRADTMVVFAVGNLYPPCTSLLQDLEPMNLYDLRIDMHHRGRLLTLRRIAPVIKLVASSWTVMQEEFSAEHERLEVFLHKSRHKQDILESGFIFTIKEPYYTLNDQGTPTLRIDHPSDLVVVTHDDASEVSFSPEEIAGNSQDATHHSVPPIPAARTARECKEHGNIALRKHDLTKACADYTEGLGQGAAAKGELIYDLFRNRAHVNLLLDRFDQAKADAIASLTGMNDPKHNGLDSKAYFRAGCAAYKLGDFQEAQSFFENQQRLSPGDRDATVNLRRTHMRLREQTNGEYDFRKIKIGLLTDRPQVDVANFYGNTEVKDSPGRGRGLFATCNIDSGQIILCEKAFCVAWSHEEKAWTAMTYDIRDDVIRGFPAGLCKAVVQKILDNPSQLEKVMQLYGDYQGIGKQLVMRDGVPLVDAFQIHDIIARNAFSLGPVFSGGRYQAEEVSNKSTGLWIFASFINHSCVPNASREHLGDLMVLRATRYISTGEEIMQSYDENSDYGSRNKALMTTWGFTCACERCIEEKAGSLASQGYRQGRKERR